MTDCYHLFKTGFSISFSIVLFSINCQAIAATFTPKGAIQGKGIDGSSVCLMQRTGL
ncbi:MAG: hypothetical protein GPJ29_21300 [Microcystis aeruginosa BK11-02]|nr:hypothetical protein [Microcystis aeruginosa BK11-02]